MCGGFHVLNFKEGCLKIKAGTIQLQIKVTTIKTAHEKFFS
jgi:hypothetical protein